ncbi:biotin transporter BioY [Clostridium beijerinckii]|uniref:biotin transporter BioY n=1 Tax=Clostridium beijerinckii TaxID=1520 RepID=UPI00047DA45F|nr:biotin transporter BioY [Clostridium beijerinckii]
MENIHKTSARQLTIIGIMSAFLCISGPFSIPIGIVPISLTNLAIYLTIYIIGKKEGTISYLIYLLIGVVGLPVFAGFSGGFTKLAGPTGGYLIGFAFMAFISGIFIDKFPNKIFMCFLGMLIGTIVTYTLGTIWLAYVVHLPFNKALTIGVLPFIPGDLAKMIIASLAGPQIRKRIKSAGLY